jgi:chemotaxis response regulator CheB
MQTLKIAMRSKGLQALFEIILGWEDLMGKKVLILSRQSLFGKGIETLLAKEPDVEIIQLQPGEQFNVECIMSHQPDVVFVSCDEPEPDFSPTILSILKEKMGVCFIGLSLNDNKISVYRSEEKQIFALSDLLNVIND